MTDSILIVDDDYSVKASLSLVLKQAGYASKCVTQPQEALALLEQQRFALVLQDMNFSRSTTGEEGLELLRRIKHLRPEVPVVLITAWGSIALAVDGIRAGAADFITKPWSNEQILQVVKTALGVAKAKSAKSLAAASRSTLDREFDFSMIIGEHPALLRVLQLVGRICKTDASVLITGDSGTGKELIADAIHRNSERRQGPFVKVNLGGISSTLFESEMFGHVKGAFTDAKFDRKGRFELAHRGTIFLDEIGDIDPAGQVKLLRVLQDRTFEVLGSSTPRKVDVRVVSATNRNLGEMVERGEFREDLLYRLNLIALHLPGLGERRSDIPLLANYFLGTIAKVYRRYDLQIQPAALTWLQNKTWPGNIRELRHLIERTVLMSTSGTLGIDDFLQAEHAQTSHRIGSKSPLPAVGQMTLDGMEKEMILKTMQYFDGNISKVADALGLSRAALYRRFEKYGIEV